MKMWSVQKLLSLSYGKGMLLVISMLFMSSGSYTFSGSFRFNEEVSDRNASVFTVDRNQKYFALFPKGVVLSRLAKATDDEVLLRPSVNIYENGIFTPEKLAAYLKLNNPDIKAKQSYNIAKIYIEEAGEEGINHDVAFSQMCLETGFLKFGGDVTPEQNNFCGLGVVGGGVKGLSFKDIRSGIRAHIQHLKAYASTDDLNLELVDERFHYVKRGIALQVNDLTGRWATDKQYGSKITHIIFRIEKFQLN